MCLDRSDVVDGLHRALWTVVAFPRPSFAQARADLAKYLSAIPYCLADVEAYHLAKADGSLRHVALMCILAEHLRSPTRDDDVGCVRPFLDERESIARTIAYLARNTKGPKVRIVELPQLDRAAVSLDECESASLDHFNAGTLLVDCSVTVASAGRGMTDGMLIITPKVKTDSLGENMQGGHLVYQGDAHGIPHIGDRMTGGSIVVDGYVRDAVRIGDRMAGGDIAIRGDIYVDDDADRRIAEDTGDVPARTHLGSRMTGGRIRVLGSVVGDIDVGAELSDGLISIAVSCSAVSVGRKRTGGRIEVAQDRAS